MADAKRVSAGGGIDAVAGILNLFGGQRGTEKVSADTSALQALLGQLQGADYSQLLQQVFQQAAGQIPGLQQAYSNAVGARSGNNSAVQASLNDLMTQATLAGTDKIINAQQNNQRMQADIGSNIAANTRRVDTKQGTNLGRAIGGLGALQGLSKLGVTDKLGKLFGVGGDSGSSGVPVFGTAAEPLFYNGSTSPMSGISLGSGGGNGLSFDLGGSLTSFGSTLGDYGSSFGDALSTGADYLFGGGLTDDIGGFFEFADGGMVGRDGKRNLVRRHLEEAENKAMGNDRSDLLKRMNEAEKKKREGHKGKDEYDKTSKMVDPKTGIRFADGGVVGELNPGTQTLRAGGARRSAAPTYDPNVIQQSLAQGFVNALGLAPAAGVGQIGEDPGLGGLGEADASNAGPAGPGFGFTDALGNMASLAINPVGFLATIADQAIAQQQNQMAAPAAPAVSMKGVVNAMNAAAAKNPIALLQALLTMSPNNAQSDEQGFATTQGIAQSTNAAAQAGVSPAVAAALGLNTAPQSVNPAMSTTALTVDSILGVSQGNSSGSVSTGGFGEGVDPGFGLGGFGVGGSADAGFGGGGEADGTSGGVSVGASGSGEGADAGIGGGVWRNGGHVKGPGGPTEDKIDAKLSNGEYVISADVVKKLGVDFFDQLQANFHKPVGL